MKREYFSTSSGYVKATWYTGDKGKVAAGYPACQNSIESFNARLRRVMRKCGHHTRVADYMENMERRMRTWCASSGDKFNIFGQNQEQTLCPLPFDKPSSDLVRGKGRVIRTGAAHLQYPTCESIVASHAATGGRNVVSFERGSTQQPAEQQIAFAKQCL